MSEYEGAVIHRSRDVYGDLVVADGALTRTLYFGRGTKQSSMFLDDPSVPAMHYMRGMMSALVFNRQPERALFIGLGGGGTVKFLRRACPGCLIEAVELRAEVIRLAHEYFALPEGHTRTRIVHGDGREYVMRRCLEGDAAYDHILVDAFDDRGPAAAVTGRDFLAACRDLLGERGLLVFDLWTHAGAGYERHRDLITDVFAGAVMELSLDNAEGNALVFAFRDRAAMEKSEEKKKTAADLQEEFGINFAKFLEDLS